MIEFEGWPKTPRLFRDIVVTEKIDGTNAAVIITPAEDLVGPEVTGFTQALGYAQQWCSDGVIAWVSTEDGDYAVAAQSRKRLITPEQDNFTFAKWVQENAEGLVRGLGPGRHFGEWWGSGIQRGYGIGRKVFSLFNAHRYGDAAIESDGLFHSVPVLYQGPFSEEQISLIDLGLRTEGSQAAPGYDNPEGFIVYHTASRQVYKVLLENDDVPKGLIA